jgi:hypothetical protein
VRRGAGPVPGRDVFCLRTSYYNYNHSVKLCRPRRRRLAPARTRRVRDSCPRPLPAPPALDLRPPHDRPR